MVPMATGTTLVGQLHPRGGVEAGDEYATSGCGLGEIVGMVIMARSRYQERRRDEAFVDMAYWQMQHDAALKKFSVAGRSK